MVVSTTVVIIRVGVSEIDTSVSVSVDVVMNIRITKWTFLWWPGVLVDGLCLVVVAAVINAVMFVVVFTVVDLSFWALDCSSISSEMVIIVVGIVSLGCSVFFITIDCGEAVTV